jgi:hypothetical protein
MPGRDRKPHSRKVCYLTYLLMELLCPSTKKKQPNILLVMFDQIAPQFLPT